MSSLGKLFIPAALAAGTVFSAFAVPLSLYGSQPLSIQLKEERIFEGSLRDVATSYLALAGLLSLGASFATCAAIGWRKSAHQAKEVETQLTQLEQQLKQKEAQLQEALVSESYLADSGLKFFLDESDTINSAIATSPSNLSSIQPAITSTSIVAKQPIPVQTTAPLHAAQSFLGFSRPAAALKSPVPNPVVEVDAIAKMQHLQTQLQHIMLEMQTIQGTFQVEAPTSIAQASMNHLSQRFQAFEPAWTVQRTS